MVWDCGRDRLSDYIDAVCLALFCGYICANARRKQKRPNWRACLTGLDQQPKKGHAVRSTLRDHAVGSGGAEVGWEGRKIRRNREATRNGRVDLKMQRKNVEVEKAVF